MIPAAVQQAVLAAVLECDSAHVQIESARRASGGCINEAWHLGFSNGLKLFLKYNKHAPPELFQMETAGLAMLNVHDGVRVPTVYAVSNESTEPQFLLLDDVLQGRAAPAPPRRGSEALGQQLAGTHRHTAGSFGLAQRMYLGLTPQPATTGSNWAEFFVEKRLNYMLQLFEQRSPTTHLSPFRAFLPKAHGLLAQHACGPSVVHGDIWSGNVLFTPAGEPMLIDPAVYYGDREVDLAMTRLFGGFDANFYCAYEEAWPLPDGWRERQDIYNLYHVLHHALLFGGGYFSQAHEIIKRF